MTAPYRIRPALEAELTALGDFYVFQMRQAFLHRQQIGNVAWYPTERFVSDVQAARRTVFDSEGTIQLLAERCTDGAIVGAIEFGPRRPHVDLDGRCETKWEIWSLYASDEMKGSRLGYNLVATALRCMLGKDETYRPFGEGNEGRYMKPGDECVVLVLKENWARGFYDKLGAVVKWQVPNYMAGGARADVVAYELAWPELERIAASV